MLNTTQLEYIQDIIDKNYAPNLVAGKEILGAAFSDCMASALNVLL